MLSAILLWSMLAALLILPVVLRAVEGEHDNGFVHSQEDGKQDQPSGTGDDEGVALAA